MAELLATTPPQYGAYYEPFAGAAALFFALRPHNALLADVNRNLIECYAAVRDSPERVVDALGKLHSTKDAYYEIRSSYPTDPAAAAARLVYLVAHSFNGLYRVNRDGRFNVPYGYRPPDRDRLSAVVLEASAALIDTELSVGDFAITAAAAQHGDLVYLDPPYSVAHSSNGFVRYNERIFSWNDQLRLAAFADALRSRGCKVIVTNADHPEVKALYPKFSATHVVRASRIASLAVHRKPVSELILASAELSRD